MAFSSRSDVPVRLGRLRRPPSLADAAEQGSRAALLARHVLDEVELQRAASLARDEDRVAYQVAHVALRAVLGRLTGRARSEVRMTCTPCPAYGGPDGVR